MPTLQSKVTSKGQVTLPKLIRSRLAIRSGDLLEFVYGFDRKAWAQVLAELLEDSAFSFDDSDRLRLVLRKFSAGKADFADYLICSAAESEGVELNEY